MRPEWLVRKSQKLVVKSGLEQKKGDFLRQRNQVIDQLGPGQRKETRKPQIEQSANENIEQNRENISKQGYDPYNSNIPKSSSQTNTKITRKSDAR